MKRVFGKVELFFNIIYLLTGFVIGTLILINGHSHYEALIASLMAFILVIGDSFHLLPRIMVVISSDEDKYLKSLGRGKQITSITMTIFYLLLWHYFIVVNDFSIEASSVNIIELNSSPDFIFFYATFVIYFLAFARILLCLLPQNKWTMRFPPVKWGIYRNLPFFILGLIITYFFFIYSKKTAELSYAWLSILLSFAFYLPVVLWANKKPVLGILMLPKTCAYVSLLIMFLNVTID